MRSSFLALAVSHLALAACSSDAAPVPEPDVETPGAFVALDDGTTGAISLTRTLDRLQLPNETILFSTVYDVDPATWEEAGEMAKLPDLPIRLEVQFLAKGPLLMHPYRVVWFRTLTEEEKDRVP